MANRNGNQTNVIEFTSASPGATRGAPQGAQKIDPHTGRILATHERQMAMLRFLRDVVVAGPALLLQWHRQNALYRELAALPDSMLNDIGLERGQIANAVYRRRPRSVQPSPGGGNPAPVSGPSGPTPGPTKPATPPATPIAA